MSQPDESTFPENPAPLLIKDDEKTVRGCVSLIVSPLLLFSKLILSSDVGVKRNMEFKKWYGDQTEVIDFVTPKRKCIKQMFQQEFGEYAISRIMFDAKKNETYLHFLRTVTDPDIQHLGTKDFKNIAWKRWAAELEVRGSEVK